MSRKLSPASESISNIRLSDDSAVTICLSLTPSRKRFQFSPNANRSPRATSSARQGDSPLLRASSIISGPPVSVCGSAQDRGRFFRLLQFQHQTSDQALQFRDPLALQLPPQASDQTLKFRDPLVGFGRGRGLFFLEDRAGLPREQLLPIRE